jgi:hypothetical protein
MATLRLRGDVVGFASQDEIRHWTTSSQFANLALPFTAEGRRVGPSILVYRFASIKDLASTTTTRADIVIECAARYEYPPNNDPKTAREDGNEKVKDVVGCLFLCDCPQLGQCLCAILTLIREPSDEK